MTAAGRAQAGDARGGAVGVHGVHLRHGIGVVYVAQGCEAAVKYALQVLGVGEEGSV